MKRHGGVALVRWIVLLALLGGLGVAGWQYGRAWLYPQVLVTRIVEGPVIQAFYATGTLLPEREFPIKANNPGMITKVFVDKGDKVAVDQPLAVVHEDAVQFKFDQAKVERDYAARMAAEDSPILEELTGRLSAYGELLDIARRERQRIETAQASGAASPADLDKALDRIKTLTLEQEALKAQRATRKLELAKALAVAEAALRTAQWNLERQTIRSPIDGVVLDRPLTVGTRLAVNDMIMHVANVDPAALVMRAAVDEEDKTLVRPGQVVHMTLYAFPDRVPGQGAGADRVFEGRVKRIYPKADPDRRTFEVDVEMVNKNPGFAAGMTGELAFIIERKDNAPVVPTQAVQGGAVWVVRDQRLAKVDVKAGLRSVERTEIVSGLRGDELVVISPAAGLKAGKQVRTTFVDPRQASAQNKAAEGEGNVFRGFK